MKKKIGRSRKVKDEIKMDVETVSEPVVIAKAPEPVIEKKEVKLDPLGPNEQYFEAPDGTIVKGSKDMGKLWYRPGNNGEGQWINPKR